MQYLFRLWFQFAMLSRMGFTPQQFKQMQERVGARTRAAAPVMASVLSSPLPANQTVLGVDPSLRGTGYGVIRTAKPVPETLTHGTISCSQAWPHSRCLVQIVKTLREVIEKTQPSVCVIEGLFYAQNLQTALVMGEARGAALSVIAEAGLEIFEMAPRKMKQAVVGYGAAQKAAVGKMVQRMLRLPEAPSADAADALALALAHLQSAGRYSLTPLKRV